MSERNQIIEAIKANPTATNKEIAKIAKDTWQRVVGIRRSAIKEGLLPKSANIVETPVAKPKGKKGRPATPKTQTGFGNSKKQQCREKFANAVINSGVTGLIATLPHVKCITEKMILASGLSNTFIARENDPEVFTAFKKVKRTEGLPIESKKGEFKELIYEADADTYSHMFADYCGGLMTLKHEIGAIFMKDVVRVGGVIGVTLSLRGSVREGDTIDQMGNNDPRDSRPSSVKGIEAFFNKAMGFKYNIEEIFQYSDSVDGNRGTAMALVIVKRIR